jgi:hypothetical protein
MPSQAITTAISSAVAITHPFTVRVYGRRVAGRVSCDNPAREE